MSAHLDHEIEDLKNQLSRLAAQVENALSRAVETVCSGDAVGSLSIISDDAQIDRLEIALEEECLKILALHQPVAYDLRFVIACLKMNQDLERIGDMACNIADRADSARIIQANQIPLDFTPMAQKVRQMLKATLDALFHADCEAAFRICRADNEIDDLNRAHTRAISTLVVSHPACAEALIHLLGVSRNLERIADCCTNIAEDIIYMNDGEIIRHHANDDAPQSP